MKLIAAYFSEGRAVMIAQDHLSVRCEAMEERFPIRRNHHHPERRQRQCAGLGWGLEWHRDASARWRHTVKRGPPRHRRRRHRWTVRVKSSKSGTRRGEGRMATRRRSVASTLRTPAAHTLPIYRVISPNYRKGPK